MLSFLHSADWQIGKPYARVEDPDKRAKLRQVRIEALDRIGQCARDQQAAFLLVAGDLFDSPTPSSSDISAVCQALGRLPCPVLVIPGNHDHGAPGSVWHQRFFQEECQRRAPNLQVLLSREPLVLEQAIVLPCPLLRRTDSQDPTAWVRSIDWEALPSDRPRILLAHGSIHGFGSEDLDADGDNLASSQNQLRLDDGLLGQLDYVALGDWHGLKQVHAKGWYSGTPEPDRFPRHDAYRDGVVLAVHVERGMPPQVTPLPTAALQWHTTAVHLSGDDELERFEATLQTLLGDEPGRHLLLLEESGSLSLEGHRRYDALLERLEAQLLRLKRRGRCAQTPDPSELRALSQRPSDPLIANVAQRLQRELEDSALVEERRELLQLALAELHRCAGT